MIEAALSHASIKLVLVVILSKSLLISPNHSLHIGITYYLTSIELVFVPLQKVLWYHHYSHLRQYLLQRVCLSHWTFDCTMIEWLAWHFSILCKWLQRTCCIPFAYHLHTICKPFASWLGLTFQGAAPWPYNHDLYLRITLQEDHGYTDSSTW